MELIKVNQQNHKDYISEGTIIQIINRRSHTDFTEGKFYQILKIENQSDTSLCYEMICDKGYKSRWNSTYGDFYVASASNYPEYTVLIAYKEGLNIEPSDVGKPFFVSNTNKNDDYKTEIYVRSTFGIQRVVDVSCMRLPNAIEKQHILASIYKEGKKIFIPIVGTKVVPGQYWEWGEQAKGAEYGVIESVQRADHSDYVWVKVNWCTKDGSVKSTNSYRCGNDIYDLDYYKEQSFTKTKTEEKMSNTSSLGFQVNIPEAAIQERVDKLVMYKLRHEKIQGVLTDVISSERAKLEIELKKELLSKVKSDFEAKKEKIIDSFIESKRTSIFLDDKLKAVIDNPTAHVELPRLISFLQLFKQAMIVGPTGSGKSTLAKQAAEALQMRYGSFSCNMEASKSELVGFANLQGYVTSQFLDFYENGGVFLVDEL